MDYEQAIDWMKRNFFKHGMFEDGMARYSLEDIPGDQVDTTGHVYDPVFLDVDMVEDAMAIPCVSYVFQVRFLAYIGSPSLEPQEIHLDGVGNGWNFYVLNVGANINLGGGLELNGSTNKTDGYSLLSTVEFYENNDLFLKNDNGGYGAIYCGHNAIPPEVLEALDLPNSDFAYMTLIRRLGANDDDGARAANAEPSSSSRKGYRIHGSRAEMHHWPAYSDAVTYTDIRFSHNYDVNHDYYDSGLYVSEDANDASLKAKIYPNPTYSSHLNSSGVITGYTPSPCGIVPWPRMSIVNGGYFVGTSPCAGMNTGGAPQNQQQSCCCPVICGLDFYGAPFNINTMMSSTAAPTIYGGNYNVNQDGHANIFWGNGSNYQYVQTCKVNVNLTANETTLKMPCPIKAIAAYEFSKRCYNAGEVAGDDDYGYCFHEVRHGKTRHPNFERFYYTVALVIGHNDEDTNKPVIDFLLPDSPRWIDKDDMPRLGTTDQIDGHATNQLGLDHLYVLHGGNVTKQIYSGSIVQVYNEGDSAPSITAFVPTGHGVPTGAGMFHDVQATGAPWFNRFKVTTNPAEGGWGKLLAHYTNNTNTLYNIIGTNSSNNYLQTNIPYSNLQSLALVLLPKWFINRR